MATSSFNISLGREVELYNRVDTNDPANSALIMLVLATGSADGINGLRDFDTVAAILAGGYTEVTNAGYARKTLTDASLSAWTPDDSANSVYLTLPLQTFTSIVAGSVWDIGIVAYDNDTTGGTDANLIPITAQELRIDGIPIPGVGDDIIWDLSSGWIQAL